MSAWSLVAFNLLVNGVGSFALGALLAFGARALFRVRAGRAQVALFALPFVKVAFDMARGVPGDSFLWMRAQGALQDLGSFRVGLGARWGVLQVQLCLGALAAGRRYTQSGADLLAALLTRRFGSWAPGAVAALLALVGVARVAARVVAWIADSRRARRLSAGAARRARLRCAGRTVVVLVVDGVEGAPFTGGVVRPYVAFPRRLWDASSVRERRAALAHEIAHVAELHVLLVSATSLVADFFWFVPFVGAALRRLRAACEEAADAWAVARPRVAPADLASALVRTQELALDAPRARRSSTLGAGDGSLPSRVARLLAGGAAPPSRIASAGRALTVVWVGAAVLSAVAFGNH